MRPRVTITNRIDDETLAAFAGRFELVANRSDAPWPRDVWERNVAGADALVAFMPDAIGETELRAAPDLRMISCALRGFDNFDVAACTRHGVLVTIVEDLLTVPGAELAIGLAIAAARNVAAGDAVVRGGSFAGWRPLLYGGGIAGANVALVGCGAIGRAIAARLRGWDARLGYWDRAPLSAASEAELGLTFRDLDELLAVADVVFLALPLSAQTRGLVDAARLARMRPGCVLVNIARGSLVDERAVANALARGTLGAYAADVFAMEDWALADRPREIPPELLAAPRTLFTPHLGSAVTAVRAAIGRAALENVATFFAGGVPPGALNPEVSDARRRDSRAQE